MTSAARQERAVEATSLLPQAYRSPRHGNKDDPVDELVFILLSQMTTHQSYGRVFDRLRAAVASWDEVLELPPGRLEALIADAGLSGQKAPRIRAILTTIRSHFGQLSLDALHAMSDHEVEAYLTSLPGVGLKAAKCVVMYSLGRPVLPVDTHVARVGGRLGLVDSATPYGRLHEEMEAAVPPDARYRFHVNAVAHARAVCRALGPRCGACLLARLCPSRHLGEGALTPVADPPAVSGSE